MSKCTVNNYGKPKTIAEELGLVNEIFEDVRIKLNQYKLDEKLPHGDVVVLPAVLGMLSEVIRAFVESQPEDNREKVRMVIASQLRSHIEEVIPWKSIEKYAGLKAHEVN